MKNVPTFSITVKSAFALLLGAALCVDNSEAGDVARGVKAPVVLATNNWGSQVVATTTVGVLLERMGQPVTYKPSSIDLQLAALQAGDLHVQVELRESVFAEAIAPMLRDGRLAKAGEHAARSREGWWYPEFVQAVCSSLPDWRALNGCRRIFEHMQTKPLGRFLAGPRSWGHRDNERVQALGLDFKVVHVQSPDALLAELDRAWKQRQAILMFRWSPHWTDIRFPGRFVEFPKYDPNCITDPSWGPNPNAIYDCDTHKEGAISKVTWGKFPDTYPCAFDLLKQVMFTSRDLAWMDQMSAQERLPPQAAAEKWLQANQERWKGWLPICANTKKARKPQ